jgi:lipoprotein-anchoring transpeptidase ErfK/SrfK
MNEAPRRNLIPFVLLLSLFMMGLGLIAWALISSPALGLTESPATSTPDRPFALVVLNKPFPTPLPTDLAITVTLPATLEAATDVQPESLQSQIVKNTPAPGYSGTTQYDPTPIYGGNKRILIDISEQHMYVYEGDTLVNDFVSSTGMNNATRAGHFSVLDKIPNAYGATWDLWMPDWLGIYWAGSMENGIHALPILSNGATLWSGYLGVPISYGCIVLGTSEAEWLYGWADIGTPVDIQW